jgi:hypothetical protein
MAEEHLLMDWTRESWVSRALVTKVSEGQVAVFFVILILGVFMLIWHLGR